MVSREGSDEGGERLAAGFEVGELVPTGAARGEEDDISRAEARGDGGDGGGEVAAGRGEAGREAIDDGPGGPDGVEAGASRGELGERGEVGFLVVPPHDQMHAAVALVGEGVEGEAGGLGRGGLAVVVPETAADVGDELETMGEAGKGTCGGFEDGGVEGGVGGEDSGEGDAGVPGVVCAGKAKAADMIRARDDGAADAGLCGPVGEGLAQDGGVAGPLMAEEVLLAGAIVVHGAVPVDVVFDEVGGDGDVRGEAAQSFEPVDHGAGELEDDPGGGVEAGDFVEERAADVSGEHGGARGAAEEVLDEGAGGALARGACDGDGAIP